MSAPYSLDLRKKVIKKIKSGISPEDIVEMFDISRSTVYRWIKRSYLGILQPTPNINKSPKKIIPNLLEDYIKQNPNKTLDEIAQYFQVKAPSIYYRIKKLNYTYKKKTFSTKKEMRKNEKNLLKK